MCPSNYFSVLHNKDDPACSLINNILLTGMPKDIFLKDKKLQLLQTERKDPGNL